MGHLRRQLRLNEVIRVELSSNRRGRDTKTVCTQRKGHTRTWGEGGCLQGKKRGLRRNQPCRHLDLGLPASRTVREQISVV